MDFVWAALCLLGAVFFAFRGGFDSVRRRPVDSDRIVS